MTTFHIDLVSGNDANDGSSGSPWLTFTLGATAARIAPGDTIKVSKTPAPYSLGDGTWTNGPVPATQGITSSTNATPIVITKNAHGYVNGDVIFVIGHSTNTAANGAWVVANKTTNTLELQGSAGNGVGGATGTMQLINSKTVKLASAQTKTVDGCDVAWTAAGGSDTTCSVTVTSSDGKEGGYCHKFLMDSATQASILQAYRAMSTTDFSAYQKLTFWIKNSAAILANTYTLNLCSDNAGVTVVDTIAIPAIPSINRWVALTIARNGGGNLGASIQSIALNTGTQAPVNSSNILIDNIEACTTSGLNLQSLISKNSSEHGGTEGWYPIQSIKGTLVLLDNETNTPATAGKGYFGTTETVTTYARETFKFTMATGLTDVVQSVTDAGTYGNQITYSGGWNTSGWASQDGETFIDGLNGNGYGLACQNKAYVTIENINPVRYYNGIIWSSPGGVLQNILTAAGCQNAGVSGDSSGANTLIQNCVFFGNNGTGYALSMGSNARLVNVTKINGNTNYGVTSTGQSDVLDTVSFAGNGQYDVFQNGPGDISLKSCTLGSTWGASTISTVGGKIYAFNTVFSGTSPYTSGTSFMLCALFSTKHGGVVGDNRIYSDGVSMQSQATDRSGADAGELMWRMTTSSANRHLGYPFALKLRGIAVEANVQRTITLWMRKGHATNVGAKLVLPGGQIAGVAADVVATKASDTSWEQLSITFTPTEAGVVVPEAWGYYIAGNSTIDAGKVDWV